MSLLDPSSGSTSFTFAQPALLCGRLCVKHDRVELTGWKLVGRYRRVVPLREIMHIDVPDRDMLVLWLADGNLLRLRIEEATDWKQKIDWLRA